MKCQVSKYLAYSMAIYTLTSIYYLMRSRSVGTPFKDSLTEEQKKIKQQSAQVRKNIFMEGTLLSAAVILATQPFKSCI